jgi:AcrR family transcriptional regulator
MPAAKPAKGRANLREPILDAASALLRDHGARAVTQSRVARAAGIPQGHLTYYFARRADLLVAVAERSVEGFSDELRAFVAQRGWSGADADMRRRVLDIIGFFVKHTQRTRLLVGLLAESDEDPAVRSLLIEHARRIRQVVAGALQRPDDDPDVEIVVSILWGLGLQHYMWSGHRPESVTDRALERLPRWFDRARRDD